VPLPKTNYCSCKLEIPLAEAMTFTAVETAHLEKKVDVEQTESANEDGFPTVVPANIIDQQDEEVQLTLKAWIVVVVSCLEAFSTFLSCPRWY